MTKETAALEAFRKQYPASNSGDLQTFVLGYQAAIEDSESPQGVVGDAVELKKIANLMPKNYEQNREYWEWGNVDDAYSYGVDTGHYNAAKIAIKALQSLSLDAGGKEILVTIYQLGQR